MWELSLGFGVGFGAALTATWLFLPRNFKSPAPPAAPTEALTPTQVSKLSARLSECEQLQQEIVNQLGRIEARDKMRKVRAARNDAPVPEPEPDNVKLTTAELRRKLAASKLTGT